MHIRVGMVMLRQEEKRHRVVGTNPGPWCSFSREISARSEYLLSINLLLKRQIMIFIINCKFIF